MTDEQIMQGLKWCYQVEGSCGDCPYRPDDIKKAKCHDRLGNDVIDLIKRQQATIEQLEAEVDTYVTLSKEMHTKAIKEFADRVKEKCATKTRFKNLGFKIEECGVTEKEIDNLVKEMGCGND